MLWLLAGMGKAEGSVARGEWRGHATALSVAPEFRRLGWAAKSMERLEEISEKEKRPERTPARTDPSIGDSFSSSPAVGRNTGFFGTDVGAAASQEAHLCSPLGCLLKHCNKFGGDATTKNQLKRYCNRRWPQYQWEDGEKWPENGSLKYNTISELMLCCRGTEKWEEMPYVDMRDWDIRKKGGLVDSKHQIGIYVLKEKKGKPRCIDWANSEEDIQLLSDPIETIQKECIVPLITTPSPNWGDVQALLEFLFTTEERRRILEKAREGLIQQGGGVGGSGVGSKHKCEGLERVKEYQQLILYGIQHGAQKPKNLSKLSEVRQGDKETPSAFSERLREVARKWTDLDPEDDSDSKLFNTLFIGQAAADIRRR
ncbi:hypothetical protein QYF61_003122 [Mycteria americana]|uniref:Core shell protein Gag P30 domain-containing protein n=2 Tax=Mycteria americana TaxID=33587 RepID=A0AAN7N696_MYCAM|nr:hypothetical protein QYF61_003117 [Mycteria americana]KAK4805250.1 hypothetical protein QYF61_003119 [Mycteria americana]KAK4805251.1 hypothetical protein QYF61_003120 [Mycteria americana]KAK4805252.1 hypothetical protein QYF61_003121 [Mycteria americana]KAK4805253.1 hypothetical protein QYF61_003122 [Mycteria americana]